MANEVVVKVRADTKKAQRSLNDLKGSGDKLNSGLKRAAKGGAIALAALGTAAAASALKMAVEFESAMAEVRTLIPDASDESFGKLNKDLAIFMREMNVASNEAVPALYSALSAGVPQGNVIEFLRVAAKAATGGVTDLATAVDGLTTVVNVYGTDTLSATQASDLMFTAVRLGKTTFGELASTLANVLPTAQAFGVSMEEVAAGLATMTAKGVPTAQATTQLRQLFVETNKETRKLAQAIVELTGKSFRDLMKEGRSAAGVLQELREEVGEEQFSQLFRSVESMNAALLMTGPNAQKMTENLRAMRDATGATEKAFQVVADTTKFKLGQAVNELRIILMQVALKALPTIVTALNATIKVIDFLAHATRFTVGIYRDFLEFLVAVFSGEWGRAWDEMQQIFAGFVNRIIQQMNVLIDGLNAVGGLFEGVLKSIGVDVDLTIKKIDYWTLANEHLATSAHSVETSLDSVVSAGYAVRGGIAVASESIVDAGNKTDDFSASAVQAANKLGQLSAQVIATTIAAKIYRAEVSGSAQDMIGATLGQMHMFEKLHNAIKESKRITEIATSLMSGVWGEVETVVRHSGSAVRDLATDLNNFDDVVKKVADDLDTGTGIYTKVELVVKALAQAHGKASGVLRRFAIRDIGLLIQQLDGPMKKSWDNMLAAMLENEAGTVELQRFLGYLQTTVSELPPAVDLATQAFERFNVVALLVTQAEERASEVTRNLAIQDIGRLVQQLEGPTKTAWNNQLVILLREQASLSELQRFLRAMETELDLVASSLRDVNPDFDKTTTAIQIMGETADGTVMSLIQLEKHLKQQGGGGGAPTADMSTWSMEDRARHNSALAAAGMLGRSGGDRGAGGVSVSLGDFAKTIGMSWAPNVGIGGMASTEQELDVARNIIRGGVESGATPEQIALMVTETMRRIAEGEGLVSQLGGAGIAGTNVTINLTGIVTDPAATGEQIIEALNAALVIQGESLVSDAVIT